MIHAGWEQHAKRHVVLVRIGLNESRMEYRLPIVLGLLDDGFIWNLFEFPLMETKDQVEMIVIFGDGLKNLNF